jgi:hypothetical protein
MGVLTALRQARGGYLVRVCGIRAGLPVERFRRLEDAAVYADYLASSCPSAVCWIFRVADGEVVYQTAPHGNHWPDWGPEDGEGTGGVREPRRPLPGSSAGSIALDLPG